MPPNNPKRKYHPFLPGFDGIRGTNTKSCEQGFCMLNEYFKLTRKMLQFKDAGKSILHISSAHNKAGPADINIDQISHLSNFSVVKLWFISIYKHSKPEKIDIQL